MSKVETIEATVNRLRKRFDELLPMCGGQNRLAKRLSDYDCFFKTSDGVYHLLNAKRGKAGEEKMIVIVTAMEAYARQAAIQENATRRTKDVEASAARRAATIAENELRRAKKREETRLRIQK
jgi:hypothetical protein